MGGGGTCAAVVALVLNRQLAWGKAGTQADMKHAHSLCTPAPSLCTTLDRSMPQPHPMPRSADTQTDFNEHVAPLAARYPDRIPQ